VLRNRPTSVAGWRAEAEGRREGKILYEVFQGTSSDRRSCAVQSAGPMTAVERVVVLAVCA
jgi:hypothetical protein